VTVIHKGVDRQQLNGGDPQRLQIRQNLLEQAAPPDGVS
jgi:hypothetical protein